MQFFRTYLRSKRKILLTALICAAIYTGSFLLYRLPLGAVLYPLGICMVAGFFVLFSDYRHTLEKHKTLERLKKQVSELIEELPTPDSIAESDYAELVESLRGAVGEAHSQELERFRDTIDYYTVWAHQIKTPLAAMKLALANEDSELSRRLTGDLFRTEQYVDMALAFLRLDSESSDYVFREYTLDDIVRPCIRQFASEFISRKLTLSYEPIAATVVTDEKWMAFVIGQILSNALKYTREGGIRIYQEENNVLCIADTGIGIAPEDLPRIFDKGYTGYNGRIDHAATGLGLYLCRRVCDKLGHGIRIDSRVGAGTTVRIDLQQEKVKAE